ncbi:hypothetical protein KR222_002496 [Zaprionus bogoriensis]|nr:hypothetical protein KR222_002496 [Zaprionus bogoriensis]
MSSSSQHEDLEDQLDNFIIRKPEQQRAALEAQKATSGGERVHEHIPLMVADLLRSTPAAEQPAVFKLIQPAALRYRSCLVYGYVAGRCVNNKSFHKYLLDDGSGTLEFSIFSRAKELQHIRCLHGEAAALVGIPESQYEQLAASMVRLLAKAMEYLDGSSIQPGSNILLWGRPNLYRNQISLSVISFLVDNEPSRQLEISFLDSLIEYYRRRQT